MAASIRGVVTYEGAPPRSSVPKRHLEALGCSEDMLGGPVVARNGKLRDVLVRLAGEVPYRRERVPAAASTLTIALERCAAIPRIQGGLLGPTDGDAPAIRFVKPPGSPDVLIARIDGEPGWDASSYDTGRWVGRLGVWVLRSGLTPWKAAFVIVSPHPHYAVTADDGAYTLEGVPPGTYEVESFHPHHGWKRKPAIEVRAGEAVEVNLEYRSTDPALDERR